MFSLCQIYLAASCIGGTANSVQDDALGQSFQWIIQVEQCKLDGPPLPLHTVCGVDILCRQQLETPGHSAQLKRRRLDAPSKRLTACSL